MTIHQFQSPDARMPVRVNIPTFEGMAVDHTKARITSIARLDIDDAVYRLDESVRVVVTCQVAGIDHKANADGDLERVHLLKAIDATIIGWDVDVSDLKPEGS